MKSVLIIIIFFVSCFAIVAQDNIEYTYTSVFQNDSQIEKRYLSDYFYDLDKISYTYSFEPSGDTSDIMIIYEDKHGNDSIEIWIYPEFTDSIKYHYNSRGKLLEEISFWGEENIYDTLSYIYNQNEKIVKELHNYDFGTTKDSLVYNDRLLVRRLYYSAYEFQLSEIENYRYNSKRLLVEIESFDDRNIRTGLTRYYYNRKGLRRKSIYKNWYYSEFVKDSKSIYKSIYNKDNKIIKTTAKSDETNIISYHYYNTELEEIKQIVLDIETGIKTIKEYIK